jgi:hypothetical protein
VCSIGKQNYISTVSSESFDTSDDYKAIRPINNSILNLYDPEGFSSIGFALFFTRCDFAWMYDLENIPIRGVCKIDSINRK